MSLVAQIEAFAQRVAQQFNTLPAPKVVFWAEENGTLQNNAYQWSFGNGLSKPTNYLPITFDGIVSQMGLNVEEAPSSTCSVEARIVRNGQSFSVAVVTLPAGKNFDVDTVTGGFRVQRSDLLQFRTVVAGGARRATVTLEITQV